ncbi:MAG TPA: sigma-70 family RNA polymerase sigma factor [Terriglobia bacterium]
MEAAIPIPAGEPNELERLFEAHYGLVFHTAYRITGNASDAEDVLQTVFLRLTTREPSAPPLENCQSYLRRAAVNAALDVVRARHAGDSELDESLPGRDQPEADRRELQDCLRRSLARLGPKEAEVFALRFLEGHSNPEIARMLGVSQVWVAVTVHRTRRRLQKEIRSYVGGRL